MRAAKEGLSPWGAEERGNGPLYSNNVKQRHQAEREIFIIFCIKMSIRWRSKGLEADAYTGTRWAALTAFRPSLMQALLRVPGDPQFQGEK